MLEHPLIIDLLVQYKYALAVPLVFVAQTAVGLAGGFLARLGHLDPFLLWGVMVASALTHDLIVYYVGRNWGDRFMQVCGPYVSITQDRVNGIKVFFGQHCTPILLVSKMTGGFGFSAAVLFAAGLSRVPFVQYVTLNLIGEAIWSAVLISVGFFFGTMYLAVEDALGRVALVTGFVMVGALAVGVGRYVHSRLARRWKLDA